MNFSRGSFEFFNGPRSSEHHRLLLNFFTVPLDLADGQHGNVSFHRSPTFEVAETSFDLGRLRLNGLALIAPAIDWSNGYPKPLFLHLSQLCGDRSFKNTRIRHLLAIRGMRLYKEFGYFDQSLFKVVLSSTLTLLLYIVGCYTASSSAYSTILRLGGLFSSVLVLVRADITALYPHESGLCFQCRFPRHPAGVSTFLRGVLWK